MPQSGWDRLEYTYETCASNSFLVVKAGAQDRIIEYQIRMLQKNKIERILPFDVKWSNGNPYFYYNITSKLDLSFFLQRRKLNRNEFIKLLADTARTLTECSGYLLNETSFIIDTERIYINPEILELSFVFVPIAIEVNINEVFKGFVTDFILNRANIEEEDCDNFLQRILGYIKKDTFNIKGFLIFLNGLLYGEGAQDEQGPEFNVIEIETRKQNPPHYSIRTIKANKRNGTGEDKDIDIDLADETNGKAGKNHERASKGLSGATIAAVILQPIIGAIVLICCKYAAATSSNPASTYLGIVVIALAIDILLVRNLMKGKPQAKSAEPSEEGIPSTIEASSRQDETYNKAPKIPAAPKTPIIPRLLKSLGMETLSDNTELPFLEHEQKAFKSPIREYSSALEETAASMLPENPPGFSDNNISNSNKTVLLSVKKEGLPVFRSRRPGEYGDIVIDSKEFVIGRLEGQVDCVLKNKAIGKVHAQILNRDGSFYIKDLNSINGTFINDIRIDSNKDYEVKDNDKVLFANSEYIFSVMQA